ncbi:MAG: MaoC/PaaZ C-terminal domain-containing protein [Evtepia sp.]|uniref:MaoC/PaaZ C-terminal domain-containing protein n=1 Tax=Evtepia sp. TaxID=2773933 RepID=UPI002A764652|nr:MaoC/PaaZ C-terminal domain-containing protein [Evtepia sp.]MDY3015309.1 MaoC/PaaZ C-terminal domain-containing protein [Evtepia sp.]
MTREEQLKGLATSWRTMPYTWRDCALYALAVGADGEEPQYTYEKAMQCVPTFGATPYWGTVNVSPRIPRPMSVPVLVEEALQPEKSYVNLDYEFVYHRPIDPVKGSFVYRDVLTGLFDRGEGRGMAVRSQVDVYDEGGNLLCENRCTTLFPTLGGYGGTPMERRPSLIPEGEPDYVAKDHIGKAQHLLYRLTGDTNLVHVDKDVARSRGLEGPFVHDLCAFGYVCRLSIRTLFPGQPQRLRRMYAAMKTVLYPDTPVELHLWQLAPGKAAFRLVNAATGKAILDKGELEWDA